MRAPAGLQHLGEGLDRVIRLFAYFGAAGLLILMMVTVVGVFARYFLNDPIFGLEDVSTMGLSVIVGASVAFGAVSRSHVAVDVLGTLAGRRVTRVTDVVARALGIAILSVAAYALFKKSGCGFDCGAFTENLAIPHPPFYIVLGLSLTLYALRLVYELSVGLLHFAGEDPNALFD